MIIHTSPPYTQPDWPSGEGHGRVATWSINGEIVDLSTEWAVYEGPHFHVTDGRLILDDSLGNRYEVDFTGEVPVFLKN
jgi:hypothetical protein